MSQQNEEPRYDNVQIENVADGTVIEGHEAVKKYLENEQKLQAEHGDSIFFQVYRLNLEADTLEELQGKKLAEIKVDRDFVSGTSTVEVAKYKVRSMLQQRAGMKEDGELSEALIINEDDRLTLYLSGRPMRDDTAFYEDNYFLLPVWIQVLLHRCESEEAIRLINELQQTR
jgi:hypothetical protein